MTAEGEPGRWLLVVAAAGYGTTGTLRAAVSGPSVWLDARAAAGRLGRADGADWVVVTGLHALAAAQQRELVRQLGRLPAAVRIGLASRRPLSRGARAAMAGPVTELGPGELALGRDAVAALLRDGYGISDPVAADAVWDRTAGWPALVRLVAAAGGVDPPDRPTAGLPAGLAAGLSAGLPAGLSAGLPAGLPAGLAAGPGVAWLRERVLVDLPGRVARLLDLIARLDPICPALCAELTAGLPGGATAGLDGFGWLVRTGLLVPHRWAPGRPARDVYRLVPLVAAALASPEPATGTGPGTGPGPGPGAGAGTGAGAGAGASDPALVAAAWYERNGFPLAAAQALARAGDHAGTRALIEDRGAEMLAAGGAAAVVHLIGLTADPRPDRRTERLQLMLGDALRMSGDVAGALRVFAPLLGRTRPAGRYPAGLAWRAGMVHYLRADYPAALDLYRRADGEGGTVDTVLLHAGRASALSMLGESGEAMAAADRAVAEARSTGDDRAIAAAHIAAGVTAVGAAQDDHLAVALAAAERAGDVVQAARALVNQTDGLLRDARYPQALDAATRALRAAEIGGPPGVLVIALHNMGEALTRLGEYAAAARQFERSVLVCRRSGLRRTALGLAGLAELHRQLGRREQSRTAFAEAVDLARATAETQVLVPALSGLARLLADPPGADLDAARELADEAAKCAPPAQRAIALAAGGWVALRAGELPVAQDASAHAVAAARAGRAADALAEALELAAAVTADPAEARAALAEAMTIWQRSGALPAADRVQVLLGRLPGADGSQRALARAAADRLADRGVRAIDGSPLLPPDGAAAPLRVQVLGGFEVWVGGQPVPLPAWRSRQARTLVKVLVARRGRPVPRPELCELLWPDDEPQRTAHRLSVLLSVLRAVFDPQRLWPADRYLRADHAGISLDLRHASVDAEILLRDAAHAAELIRRDQPERAREILAELDASHRGDAFDDEPYAEWADPLREQARAARLRALRDLAELSRRAGETEQAVSCLVRLLAADPFDEPAHRALVGVLRASGRHGEAKRAFDRWARAMASIDVPAPDPALLNGRHLRHADAPLTPR
jgi:DNA-binding SARP family transcriptional activator